MNIANIIRNPMGRDLNQLRNICESLNEPELVSDGVVVGCIVVGIVGDGVVVGCIVVGIAGLLGPVVGPIVVIVVFFVSVTVTFGVDFSVSYSVSVTKEEVNITFCAIGTFSQCISGSNGTPASSVTAFA